MDQEIDEHIQLAYDLADWAMDEAQVANDLLVMLLEVVSKTHPETARRFRNKVQSTLEAKDVVRSGAFQNSANRIIGLLDGKEPYFNSFTRFSGDGKRQKRPTRPVLRIIKPDDDKGD